MGLLNRKKPKVDKTGHEIHEVHPTDSLITGEKVQEILTKLGPFIQKAGDFLDFIGPKIVSSATLLMDLYKKAEPYKPEIILAIISSLMMVYFGGHFVTTIAAVEAFRLVGYDKIKEHSLIIYENYNIAREASEKDDKVDANNDGIPDVEQISKKELTTRKLKILLKSVDPEKISEALFFFQCSCFAVLATLKAKFALAITLGASIGETLENQIGPIVQPAVRTLIPEEYHKWIPVALAYVTKSIGVAIAWSLVRIVSAFHSSIRGGHLLVKYSMLYAVEFGFIKEVSSESSSLFMILGAFVAISGFYSQIGTGFELPLLLQLLLLPVIIAENFLIFVVNYF